MNENEVMRLVQDVARNIPMEVVLFFKSGGNEVFENRKWGDELQTRDNMVRAGQEFCIIRKAELQIPLSGRVGKGVRNDTPP
jgi:hypothetical protein